MYLQNTCDDLFLITVTTIRLTDLQIPLHDAKYSESFFTEAKCYSVQSLLALLFKES